MTELFTIGVYGFNEETFYQSLSGVQIQVFCDIRQRRGLRGSKYAFANSSRLQRGLAAAGITYIYRKDLAPSPEIRQLQKSSDSGLGILKSERRQLSGSFIAAYQQQCLFPIGATTILDSFRQYDRVVFCCVEEYPAACHRSVLATFLHQETGVPVKHLVP